MPSARNVSSPCRVPASLIATPLFLSESVQGLADGAGFLKTLSDAEQRDVKAAGRLTTVAPGDYVFTQGEPHTGIFVIEAGRVRVFYTGPSGREVTLAYWTPGNFVGGPSIRGGGTYQWSGVAIEAVTVIALSPITVSSLMRRIPRFAICLIEGLEAKGRCYTAMAQMLGTRSVIERLAQLLLNLGELYGTTSGGKTLVINMITHDEIAALVGSTRQWVTMMLRRFKDEGTIATDIGSLTILKAEALRSIVRGEV